MLSIFLVGFQANVPVLGLVASSEFIDSNIRCLLLEECWDFSRRVIRVLDFHANVGGFVDIGSGNRCLSSCDTHVKLKALVHLILAVLDAGKLSGSLGRESFTVDAVKMASTEEKLREGRLHQCITFVLRVLRPGARRLLSH